MNADEKVTDSDDDTDWWCEKCEEYFYESHYHCGNCDEVSGMFGHWDVQTQGFSCHPVTEAKQR